MFIVYLINLDRFKREMLFVPRGKPGTVCFSSGDNKKSLVLMEVPCYQSKRYCTRHSAMSAHSVSLDNSKLLRSSLNSLIRSSKHLTLAEIFYGLEITNRNLNSKKWLCCIQEMLAVHQYLLEGALIFASGRRSKSSLTETSSGLRTVKPVMVALSLCEGIAASC